MGTYPRCDDRLAAAQNGLMKAQSLRGWRLSPAFAIIAIAGLQAQAQWPRIAPLDTLFRVQDATHPDVKTFIKSPTGKPIYLLICRQSDDPALAQLAALPPGDFFARFLQARAQLFAITTAPDERQPSWHLIGVVHESDSVAHVVYRYEGL